MFLFNSLSFFFLFFLLFRAIPVAYGGSQAGGRIRAIAPATAAATATQDPSHVCDLHHSSGPRQILNPLNEVRDGTQSLMVPSQIVSTAPPRELPNFISGVHILKLEYSWS